jgi:hypothetical protein
VAGRGGIGDGINIAILCACDAHVLISAEPKQRKESATCPIT